MYLVPKHPTPHAPLESTLHPRVWFRVQCFRQTHEAVRVIPSKPCAVSLTDEPHLVLVLILI